MSETNVSQSHNPQDAVRKMVDEQLARMAAGYEEAAKMEAKFLEGARTAIEESARMFKDSLAYATQLSAEWRKVSLDAAKRASQLVQPRS